MPDHSCDRDKCPPNNTKGPTTKCTKCGKLAFLLCHGFVKHGDNFVKYTLANTSKVVISTSSLNWFCQLCITNGSVFTEKGPMTSTTTTTPAASTNKNKNEQAILNSLNELKNQLATFQSSSNEMNMKLDTKLDLIDAKATETKLISDAILVEVKSKPAESNQNGLIQFGATPTSSRPFRPELNHGTTKASFASLFRENGTPSHSNKRRRGESQQFKPIQQTKPNVPPPKVGTNTSTSRLVAVDTVKPPQRPVKPKFEKAVWVSRLPPVTTEDEIREHISELKTVSPNYEIHKLLKKGRDVSELKFISFKIAVNVADFEILNDPSMWPMGVLVREFVENKPTTFGDFLRTNLNAKDAPKQMSDSNAMEVQTDNVSTAPRNPEEIIHVGS